MAIVTGDRYIEHLVKFVEEQAGPLIEGPLVLKLNPVGLHYVQSRFETFAELENLLAGAPVDYLRAYISDLGDHRALEQLRRILRLLTSLKVVSVLPVPARDPMPLSLLPFGRLKVLELRGCDLSTSAARGLLELRHTLEKIICHNSTDALRHVFASRIAEIKNSLHWNCLQFVSCACNGLVLMDESLQLLSAVETLDLSRNRFTKVDNLRLCSRLKNLDLGFNHLTTISSLTEASHHLVRLVLRNNALTSLRGIENLKSLEGLDLSYNIISSFSEIEILAGLPCLQSLWLEGNPLCCARWYRSQVFSLLTHPETVKLDEKHISTREFFKMQISIASRQKRPASFGFYSPAIDDAEGVEGCNTKRKKFSRLASIVAEDQSISSDQESVLCDNEIHSRENDVISDDGSEVVDLPNKVELKKTRQIHHLSESSRNVSDSIQPSGDESSTNILEPDNSFVDSAPLKLRNSLHGIKPGHTGHKTNTDASVTSVNSIDDMLESHSSSVCPCPNSPPHFREDILHRRHTLVEEFLQLSAKSFSAVSSDSYTSSSEDDDISDSDLGSSVSDFDQLLDGEISNLHVGGDSSKPLVEDKDCDLSEVSLGEYTMIKCKRKKKKRVVSLHEGKNVIQMTDKLNGYEDSYRDDLKERIGKRNNIEKRTWTNTIKSSLIDDGYGALFGVQKSFPVETDDFIHNYFNSNVADLRVNETCKIYLRCDCIIEQELRCRDVAVLLSSENILYLLHVDDAFNGSENILRLIGRHRTEDIGEVLVGLGLQVVRVFIEREVSYSYLFMTNSIEKSRQLLCALQVADAYDVNHKCPLRSLEQVQVDLFEETIGGGSKFNIYQYSMVLFFCNNGEEESWLLRSLFVIGGHLLVCFEDLMLLSSLSGDASPSSPYFTLDSCCSLADISEMVIEGKESRIVTLALECSTSEFNPSAEKANKAKEEVKSASMCLTWKLKWFSEESLFKFAALLKALHAGSTMSPLLVRYIQ